MAFFSLGTCLSIRLQRQVMGVDDDQREREREEEEKERGEEGRGEGTRRQQYLAPPPPSPSPSFHLPYLCCQAEWDRAAPPAAYDKREALPLPLPPRMKHERKRERERNCKVDRLTGKAGQVVQV